MMTVRTTAIATTLVALAWSAQPVQTQGKLPNIAILATGGTIAGAAATGTQSGYTSGAVGIDTMVAAVPGIDQARHHQGRADRQRRLAGHELRRSC